MTTPLKLGTKPRWGETTCGFGVDRPDCDKPAVWHLMWLDSGSVSAACEEHLAYIDSRQHPEYERHSFAPNCGMPGVWWQHPNEGEEEGYCFFPANDDASAMEAAELAVAEGEKP